MKKMGENCSTPSARDFFSSKDSNEQDHSTQMEGKDELNKVLGEEEGLNKTKKGLMKQLAFANHLNVRTLKEVKVLKRMIQELQKLDDDDGNQQQTNLGAKESGEKTDHTKLAEFILPDEMWEQILRNLDGREDLLNASKACRLFEWELHPRKPEFWYHQVFRHVFQHLKGTDILRCRNVCKEWNLVVDEFMGSRAPLTPSSSSQGDEEHHALQQGILPANHMSERKLGFVFNSDDIGWIPPLRTGQWYRGIIDHPRNPFVGASFSMIFNGVFNPAKEEGWEIEYFGRLYDLLERRGEDIWHLTVILYGSDESGVGSQRIYRFLLYDLLRLLPNLRSFRLEGELFWMWQCSGLPYWAGLELDTLDICRLQDYGLHLYQMAMLDRHRLQLRKLRIEVEMNWAEGCYGKYLELPCLEELTVDGIINERDDFAFFSLMMTPNLKRLELRIDLTSEQQRFCPMDSFDIVTEEVVNVFGKPEYSKLSSIRLQIVPRTVFPLPFMQGYLLRPDRPSLLMPPNVTTLEVEYFPETSHSFLLHYPFIRSLVFFTGMEQPWMEEQGEGNDELVQIHEYLFKGNMYKSNIWGVIPQLQLLTFQINSRKDGTITRRDLYTRHGYELRSAKGQEEKVKGKDKNGPEEDSAIPGPSHKK